jgi:hypothetical protein
MLPVRIVCFVCVILLALVGCGKKESKTKTTSLLTQIPKTQQAPPAVKDSADIFDEFYDKGGAKSASTKAADKKVKEPTFSTATASSSTAFSPEGPFVVQVSCVASRKFADKQVSSLDEKGYPAYIAEVSNPTPDLMGSYYRVRIGGFSTISKAKEFGENTLVPAGWEYWVDNRSNDKVGMGGSGLGSSSKAGAYTEPAKSSSSSSSWGTSSSGGSAKTTSEWGSSSSVSSTTPAPSTPTTTSTTESSDWGSAPAATPAPSAAGESSTTPAPATGSTGSAGSSSSEWSNDSSW